MMWDEPFGKGASGRVYKAIYLPLCKIIAAKVTSRLDKLTVKQLLEEYEAQTNLLPECEQLMKVYGWYRDMENNEVVIALEYMDMASVYDSCFPKARDDALNATPEEMERSGHKQILIEGLTYDQLRFIAREVLLGLYHLHSQPKPLIHRDIKPQNILLSSSGEVKVADFGLLHQLQSANDVCRDMDGTMKYFAPERADGEFSTGADIWALGITLIEIHRQELLPQDQLDLFKIVEDGIHLEDYLESSAPAELVSFLEKCLTKTSEQRPNAFDLLQHPLVTDQWGPALPLTLSNSLEQNSYSKPPVQFAALKPDQKTLDKLLRWLEEWILSDSNAEVFEKGNPQDMRQCVVNLAKYSGYSPNYIDTYIADVYREFLGE
ncbi:MAP kinase kinase [Reticulomyxa filosa]|uniref:mitogen-activated protein kinase kinase n=1 Tax=Reticulomyxa filosa TaxID=46433 RepID=X6P2L0_RETFI|nr:MAP kinase kinase [Reticulomyxa filosa]|eukprot:ETO32446.1 MAP kinase kinase [Reticulomyxa filosa]